MPPHPSAPTSPFAPALPYAILPMPLDGTPDRRPALPARGPAITVSPAFVRGPSPAAVLLTHPSAPALSTLPTRMRSRSFAWLRLHHLSLRPHARPLVLGRH